MLEIKSETNWLERSFDERLADVISQEFSIPRPLALMLTGRGFSDLDKIRKYFDPRLGDLSDPYLLPDSRAASKYIWDAVLSGKKILVFGDYDADGVTSTALMVDVLSKIGGKISSFLPERMADGYGLNPETLKRCIAQYQPDLIVTVDCGTSSLDAIEMAKKSGVEVVVTDHHECLGEHAPALAVVNPKLGDDDVLKNLAGVGVAFKVCHALMKYGREIGCKSAAEIDLRKWLDLVAIGTVADVVPLTDENRILVKYGIDRLNKKILTTSKNLAKHELGLCALVDKVNKKGALTCRDLGFGLAPRINAAGRMGSADIAYSLFRCEDWENAVSVATTLDDLNTKRKQVEMVILKEATAMLEESDAGTERFSVVVGSANWHQGAIGIVASRLCSLHYRPSVVISFDKDGIGHGSCRSIENLNIVEVLSACSDLLTSYGGHKQAAGLVIDKNKYHEFQDQFNKECSIRLKGKSLKPINYIDAWITMPEADIDLCHAINKLQPLGQANTAPVWAMKDVRIIGEPRKVGKDHKHLKMSIGFGGSQIDTIAFNMGDRPLPDGKMDIIFQLQEDTFRGNQKVQLMLIDFRTA